MPLRSGSTRADARWKMDGLGIHREPDASRCGCGRSAGSTERRTPLASARRFTTHLPDEPTVKSLIRSFCRSST